MPVAWHPDDWARMRSFPYPEVGDGSEAGPEYDPRLGLFLLPTVHTRTQVSADVPFSVWFFSLGLWLGLASDDPAEVD